MNAPAPISIDPEFKGLIPPLSAEELALLEANILRDGCRDPLTVWNGILLDGHNRHQICTRHNIAFDTFTIELPDRDAAMDWMDANQLGRRNLTKEAHDLLLGRRYNRTKKAAHGRDGREFSEDQSDTPKPNTAAKLAVEHGVSEATVKRAGQFAEAVEAQGLEAEALAGKLKGKKKEVVEAHRKASGKGIPEKDLPALPPVAAREESPAKGGKFVSDDAERLYLLAWTHLEKILPIDKSRERVLRKLITYAEGRLQNNK